MGGKFIEKSITFCEEMVIYDQLPKCNHIIIHEIYVLHHSMSGVDGTFSQHNSTDSTRIVKMTFLDNCADPIPQDSEHVYYNLVDVSDWIIRKKGFKNLSYHIIFHNLIYI